MMALDKNLTLKFGERTGEIGRERVIDRALKNCITENFLKKLLYPAKR